MNPARCEESVSASARVYENKTNTMVRKRPKLGFGGTKCLSDDLRQAAETR